MFWSPVFGKEQRETHTSKGCRLLLDEFIKELLLMRRRKGRLSREGEVYIPFLPHLISKAAQRKQSPLGIPLRFNDRHRIKSDITIYSYLSS
jgi:hypothetical protein